MGDVIAYAPSVELNQFDFGDQKNSYAAASLVRRS